VPAFDDEDAIEAVAADGPHPALVFPPKGDTNPRDCETWVAGHPHDERADVRTDMEQEVKTRLGLMVLPSCSSSEWPVAATVDQTDIRRSKRHDW
jgi:hypothetical protein